MRKDFISKVNICLSVSFSHSHMHYLINYSEELQTLTTIKFVKQMHDQFEKHAAMNDGIHYGIR